MLYIRPHEYAAGWQGLPILPILLMICFGSWLARQPKIFEAPQHRLLVVQLIVMCVSVVVNGWGGGAVTVASEFGAILLLYYIVSTSVDSLERLRAIFLLLTVASVIMSVHGAQQVESGTAWTGATTVNGGRITYLGFLADPNDLAMSMLMTLPMCLYLTQPPAGFLVRQLCRIGTLIILYGIYLTNSRGAMLALGSMVFLYAILRFGFWRSVLIVPSLAIPILLSAPGRLSEMSSEEESAAGRVDAWYQGFQMLISHPIFGVGKGMFTDHHWLTAHNSFVLVLAELGLVGYFVWLSVIAVTVVMLWNLVWAEVPLEYISDAAAAERLAKQHQAPTLRAIEPSAAITVRPMPASDRADWLDWQRGARALLYGMVAALVCSFFLSRSYVIILYVHIGLVVATHQYARSRWTWVKEVSFARIWGYVAGATVVSTLALWVATRVLL